METPPTIGRIVHYVLPLGHPAAGEVRPAVITKVWGPGRVNLRVALDVWDRVELERNDQSSVVFSLTPQPGTWHWPDRAPNHGEPSLPIFPPQDGHAVIFREPVAGGVSNTPADSFPAAAAGAGQRPLSTGEALLGATAV